MSGYEQLSHWYGHWKGGVPALRKLLDLIRQHPILVERVNKPANIRAFLELEIVAEQSDYAPVGEATASHLLINAPWHHFRRQALGFGCPKNCNWVHFSVENALSITGVSTASDAAQEMITDWIRDDPEGELVLAKYFLLREAGLAE